MRLNPSGADVVLCVPGLVEGVDSDEGARVRGVDELVVAEVDADVVERVEEDEVARLELGDGDRCPECPLRGREVPKFVIDHHRTQDDLGATRLVDIEAEATGRLVWEAFRALGKVPSPAAASSLFTALAMDTGWFHHSNMRAATFELAAALAAAGAEAHLIYEYLYERNSPARMRLQGRVLERHQLVCGGRIAVSEVYLSDYPETGAYPLDTEDFVQLLRAIDGVDVGLLLIEQIAGEVKVSFRSRPTVDVSKVAEAFGGGGHARASGATVAGPLGAAVVLDAVAAAQGEIRSRIRDSAARTTVLTPGSGTPGFAKPHRGFIHVRPSDSKSFWSRWRPRGFANRVEAGDTLTAAMG